MPGWNRKIYDGPEQYNAYRIAKLLELTAKAASGCCTTTTTTTSTSTSTTSTTTTTTTTP